MAPAKGGAGLPKLVPASWALHPEQKMPQQKAASQKHKPLQQSFSCSQLIKSCRRERRQWPCRDSGGAVNWDYGLRQPAPGAHPTASL